MCQHGQMSARQVARVLGAALAVAWTVMLSAPVGQSAFAAVCPDVEVVFARATTELPGVGGVGQAFVDALRPQVGSSRSPCTR